MEEQLVVFELGKEKYGLNISTVEGIIKIQTITKIPRASEFVEGVTNLRGMVVPVIDLRKRFGMPIFENTKDTRIVIVNMGQAKVGIIVDGVSEVLMVQEENIEPTPPMVSTVHTAFIRGIAKITDRLITVLDLSKVLNFSEITAVTKLAN